MSTREDREWDVAQDRAWLCPVCGKDDANCLDDHDVSRETAYGVERRAGTGKWVAVLNGNGDAPARWVTEQDAQRAAEVFGVEYRWEVRVVPADDPS